MNPAEVNQGPDIHASAGFSDLPGWADDDHGAAFAAFRRSCVKIKSVADARAAGGKPAGDDIASLVETCRLALDAPEAPAASDAKAFFERHFTARPVGDDRSPGFLTGYFEPEIEGDREPSARFHVPILAKPDDLVPLIADTHRAAHNHELTAGRRTAGGIVAYATRKDIEAGALAGRGLELLYLADRFAAYIMHVQGSGRIVMPNGAVVRLAYAAKNGHPYTSIGRILIERGEIAKEDMSLDALDAWVRRNPDAGRELMWENKSYIFFRELEDLDATLGPVGAQGVALTPGRSLAVDASIHDLGTPVWVDAPGLEAVAGTRFRRLMVAQDVGSAIKGPERGDIFWGSGEAAGRTAGLTRHEGRFWVLVPRAADAVR